MDKNKIIKTKVKIMDIEYTDARINLPKDGVTQLQRICKARTKCTTHCEHRKPHIVSLACHIRCCDTPGKDVRCVPVE